MTATQRDFFQPDCSSSRWCSGGTVTTGYTLTQPIVGPEVCYRNGLKQAPGIDYTLAGQMITFAPYPGIPVPADGDILECDYPTSGAGGTTFAGLVVDRATLSRAQ